MKTVALIMQKGGVGKSTIARAMAVAAVQAGYKTMLIDTDLQDSQRLWGKRRTAAEPVILQANENSLEEILEKGEADGYELAIIDTPPARSPEANISAEVADLVITPIHPSPEAYEQVPRTARLVRVTEAKSLAVPSMVHPSSRNEAGAARNAAVKVGLTPASGQITTLRTHQHASVMGQVASEFEPEGRAAQEMQALFMDMCAHLGLCKTAQKAKGKNRK